MIDTIIDTSGFIIWLKDAEAKLQANARQALGQSVETALRAARATRSFKDQSGALRKSITRGQKSTWVHFIQATAPHAAYVEHGTRPHRIEARKASTLRFFIAGRLTFRRHVDHPGTKATNFMEHAGKVGELALRYAIEKAVEDAFR